MIKYIPKHEPRRGLFCRKQFCSGLVDCSNKYPACCVSGVVLETIHLFHNRFSQSCLKVIEDTIKTLTPRYRDMKLG